MVVLKGEMPRCLYKLVENVQTGGTAGRATTSDSSDKQVVRRKQLTFGSSAKGDNELSESS